MLLDAREEYPQGLNAAVTIYNFLFVSTIMLLFNKFIRRKEVEL